MAAGIPSWDRMGSVCARFGLAACDQAIFAGTSFLFTLLLARWMIPTEFGAFAVAYSVYMLVQSMFDGLMAEPLAVFGAGRLAAVFPAYLGRVLAAHVAIGCGIAVAVGLVAGGSRLLGMQQLASGLAGLAMASPFLCARSLTRQPFYVKMRVHLSLPIGVLHLVCSVAGLSFLHATDMLTPFAAFLALGVGSLIASGAAVLFFHAPTWRTSEPELAVGALVRAHLGYGGWAIGERLLAWLQSNLGYLLLPFAGGLHASAAYRAASTLSMPAYMTITSATTVLLPMLSQTAAMHPARLPSWQRHLPLLMMLGTLIYAVPLAGLGAAVADPLFDGRYSGDFSMPLMTALALGVVLFAIGTALEVRLRARLQIRRILAARLVGTIVALTAGAGLTFAFGLIGAVLAIALTWLSTIVALRRPPDGWARRVRAGRLSLPAPRAGRPALAGRVDDSADGR